jgi:hypothetical protein
MEAVAETVPVSVPLGSVVDTTSIWVAVLLIVTVDGTDSNAVTLPISCMP